MAMSEAEIKEAKQIIAQKEVLKRFERDYETAVIKLAQAGLNRGLTDVERRNLELVCIVSNKSDEELATFIFRLRDNILLQVWRGYDGGWKGMIIGEEYSDRDGHYARMVVDTTPLGRVLGSDGIEIFFRDAPGTPRFAAVAGGVKRVAFVIDRIQDNEANKREFMGRVVNYANGNSL